MMIKMQDKELQEQFQALGKQESIDSHDPGIGKILGAATERSMQYWTRFNSQYFTREDRRGFLSEYFLTELPEDVNILPPLSSDGGLNITIGRRVFINSGCRLQDLGGITIEDDVFIGHNVVLATINHDLAPAHRAVLRPQPIRIAKGAWIGANVTITAGVTVGEGAVVAAGAVVTKNVPPNTVVGGVPAQVLKEI